MSGYPEQMHPAGAHFHDRQDVKPRKPMVSRVKKSVTSKPVA
jgi:hypothetical protein